MRRELRWTLDKPIRQFLCAFLDLLFPERCLICNKGPVDSQGICEYCLSSIKYISSPACSKCGIPFNSDAGEDHLCGICLTSKVHFSKARAVGFFEGVLQEAIHQFKYNRKTILAKPLGDFMVNCNRDSIDFKAYDFLVPVPLHPRRLRERGFNQALSLAKRIAKRCGVPVDYLSLKRVRWEKPQINLSRKERERNVRGAFAFYDRGKLSKNRVLLIDDVCTSGATVNECARVLMEAGTRRVDVLTLCRAL